jgi:hypothetical protein
VQVLEADELMPTAKWLTPKAVTDIPKGEPVALIGDGKAFLYQIPMSKLRYRTVFDVDDSGGKDFVEAFAGKLELGTFLIVSPSELRRFEKTYQPFPSAPGEMVTGEEPFVLRSGR